MTLWHTARQKNTNDTSFENLRGVSRTEQKMLSVETRQKILSGNGKNYTHEEIKKLRDFLYLLGEMLGILLKHLIVLPFKITGIWTKKAEHLAISDITFGNVPIPRQL